MTLAVVRSRAVVGLRAPAVTVEVHASNGLPQFLVVGLAETEVKESRERVRSALINSGFEFPHNKKLVVNLAPADLPKDSGRLDLPIALGVLAASGQIDAAALSGWEFAGELSLSGELRPIRGALAMAAAMLADDAEPAKLVLPPTSATEAACVADAQVYGAAHLLDVAAAFAREADARATLARVSAPQRVGATSTALDMADVKAQSFARRALEIAAAGGHSMLLVGPPGAGKSMLAQRLSSLLPPLDAAQSLEVARISDAAGRFDATQWGVRPLVASHHSASAVALVGGGSPPRPGEISRASHGVLFLDELPEFARTALEALREPLENGKITISRAAHSVEFPANFQLIGAMNPCPCGYLGSKIKHCRCTPDQVSRYQGRLSGPLLDRIDLHIEVEAVPPEQLVNAPPGEASAPIAARVAAAQNRAQLRQGCLNRHLSGQLLDVHTELQPAARQFLTHAAQRLGWSARATHRTLRVARTIADLAQASHIDMAHIAEAMQMRRALLGASH
jgi:magnesium chelatase family protein